MSAHKRSSGRKKKVERENDFVSDVGFVAMLGGGGDALSWTHLCVCLCIDMCKDMCIDTCTDVYRGRHCEAAILSTGTPIPAQ